MPEGALARLAVELEGLRSDYQAWRESNYGAVPEARLAVLEFALRTKIDAISATIRQLRSDLVEGDAE